MAAETPRRVPGSRAEPCAAAGARRGRGGRPALQPQVRGGKAGSRGMEDVGWGGVQGRSRRVTSDARVGTGRWEPRGLRWGV